jgi:hypothetical protein
VAPAITTYGVPSDPAIRARVGDGEDVEIAATFSAEVGAVGNLRRDIAFGSGPD